MDEIEVSRVSRAIRTAVAAAVSHASRMQIVRGLADAGVHLDRLCDDGSSALRALRDFRPDLLVADAFLPGMDGQSLAKHALCSFELPVRPAVLLLYDGHYPLPEGEYLRRHGAALLNHCASLTDFISAVERLRSEEICFTDRELQSAAMLLDALGVPEHLGRDCLKLAVLFCAVDQRLERRMGAQLYPKVGEACGVSARQVERSIRHVIDLAWRSDKFDNQYRIFADTVDAGRGQPTCGEMILRLADILRLEG